MFILDLIDRELHSLYRLELKFDSRLEFFYKIPVRILLDVLFGEFRFSKVSYMPGPGLICSGIFIHDILKLRRHLDTETYGSLPWQFCNYKLSLKFRAKT